MSILSDSKNVIVSKGDKMTYEELLLSAEENGIDVTGYHFDSERIKGLYCDGTIALNSSLTTNAEKACVLSEELGHYHTSSGNILNLQNASNRKQEYRARMWGYNNMIGLKGLIQAYKKGCQSVQETAEYLNVTEEFLQEAIACYKSKYGRYATMDNYVIYFEPCISVLELV